MGENGSHTPSLKVEQPGGERKGVMVTRKPKRGPQLSEKKRKKEDPLNFTCTQNVWLAGCSGKNGPIKSLSGDNVQWVCTATRTKRENGKTEKKFGDGPTVQGGGDGCVLSQRNKIRQK